ncbi:MAG TPA: MATE family efflux transporter, partial [Flavobacteriaceae bacterium]|nr:MATE family efflux transporter [Flavobacteriaceae bacterium]
MTNTTKPSIWQDLKNAIRGTEADYTQIALKRAIFLLAIPMILELIMESAFAVADIYFVGSLGPSAVATVGLTETYLYLLYSIAMGLSVAVTAVVARRIGEKNKADASKAAVQAIVVGVLASIPFSVAGIFYAKELLTLMGGDIWVVNEGYRYTQWML